VPWNDIKKNKMNNRIQLAVLLFLVLNLVGTQSTKSSIVPNNARVELLVEYKVGKDLGFVKNDQKLFTVFPQHVFFQNGEIIMYTGERSIVIYNIESKVTYNLNIIDSFINEKYPNSGISGFFVKGDSIYIGVTCKKIALFNRKSQCFLMEFSGFPSCIDNFSVFNNNTIFAFNNDELYRVSSDIAITKYSTDGILPEVLVMSNDTLVVSAAFGHTISLFAVSSMGESKDLNFGINDTEMIWFSTVTKSNYVWISSSLKGIWLCNKLNRQKRLVLFDQDFLDAPRQSPLEDNRNGIRVVSESDTVFYFVIMRNNNIQLYKVSI
jgi:hypothetical protein